MRMEWLSFKMKKCPIPVCIDHNNFFGIVSAKKDYKIFKNKFNLKNKLKWQI